MCYRRLDSEEVVDRIYESLELVFPREALCRDIDTIPAGVDFREYVQDALRNCHVALIFIGRDWLDARDESGSRRLDDPGDHVRIEIETALQVEGLRVIPVLVRRAVVPAESELPPSLAPLAFRNAIPVRTGSDYHGDVARLASAVQNALAEWAAERAAKAAAERDKEYGRPADSAQLSVELRLKKGTIFLSGAYEDRGAARRLAEILPAQGLNVWLEDHGATPEMREARTRAAMRQCVLFLPLISPQTEKRDAGLFRTQWSQAIASSRYRPADLPFILPMLLGHLEPEQVRFVPPEFTELTMTHCPGGKPPSHFVRWLVDSVPVLIARYDALEPT